MAIKKGYWSEHWGTETVGWITDMITACQMGGNHKKLHMNVLDRGLLHRG